VNDTSKTAKITAHRLNVNVLLSNITFFNNFFAVLDVLFAVN